MNRIFSWVNRLTSVQAILSIAIISIVVKLGYIIFLGGGLDAFPREGSDVHFYDGVARVLLRTGVYGWSPDHPTVEMPPGQSAFLAFLYAVSGSAIAFAKLAHVLVLTLVAILTYLIGKTLTSHVVGFWSGILIALDPAQAYLAGTFLSEPLFIFLMVLGIYLLARSRSHMNWGWLIGAGICFGLAGLTRNQGWLFAIMLWLGALVTTGRLMSLRAATLVLVACVATIAPWTLRNYLVTGTFVPVSSEGGLTLWACNNPEFVWRPPMPMSLPIYAAPPNLSGSNLDAFYRERALNWIISHPVDFLVNGLRKIIVLYNFDPMSWRSEMALLFRLAGIFPYGVILPFIAVGLVANVRNSSFTIILYYILFTTLMAAMFYGDSRIRAPIQPYLYLFGVMGVQHFAVWLNARRVSRLPGLGKVR